MYSGATVSVRISRTPPDLRGFRMETPNSSCVILADRNAAASESIRGLLEAEFENVYLVADTGSLTAGVGRLMPQLIVVDLSTGPEKLPRLLSMIQERSPGSHVIVVSLDDEAVVARSALAAGAEAVVLKRCAGTDLFQAIAAVNRGERYLSPQFQVALS